MCKQEEIDEMFEMGLPARKFRTYQTRGRAEVSKEEKKSIEHEKEVAVLRSEKVATETNVVRD